jgi:hypothetical protein
LFRKVIVKMLTVVEDSEGKYSEKNEAWYLVLYSLKNTFLFSFFSGEYTGIEKMKSFYEKLLKTLRNNQFSLSITTIH